MVSGIEFPWFLFHARGGFAIPCGKMVLGIEFPCFFEIGFPILLD
jgi:hypothetical protein